MQTVLTIAGFDPSSGAGVTADLAVFAAHGLFGTACITSLTVQSTKGVRASHPVEPVILADTLACLIDDLPPSGIKIGMLGSKQAVEVVCNFLEGLRATGSNIPVVVDPVLRASSGSRLLAPGAAHMLRTRLFPLADWITPNRDELSWLTTLGTAKGRDWTIDAAKALQQEVNAQKIWDQGGRQVHIVAKGGDLDPPDDLLLTVDGTEHWLTGERIETRATHGTGCAFSSALLSRLVLGDTPLEAARSAKSYVAEAMRQAPPIGHGHGPMNHLWPLR